MQVWGCDTVYKCTDVCPKQVPPTQAGTGMWAWFLQRITGNSTIKDIDSNLDIINTSIFKGLWIENYSILR